MDLFDAHCHLQDPRFGGRADEVIAAARDAGVQRFSVQGTCEDDWAKIRELAERCPGVTPNFGLHPWWVAGRSEHWLQRLREALEATPTAGLGECGLDKAHQGVDMATQERVFRQQLQLGKELRRPISVHCVKAYGMLLEAVQELGPFPAELVLHSFAGPAEMVAPLAKVEGVHFSISGHITKLHAEKAAAMLKQVPLDRLLLETDSPDGLPQVSDAQLARKVEAAAGCTLRVLTLPEHDSTDDGTSRHGSRGASSSGQHAELGRDQTPAGGSSTAGAGCGERHSDQGERQAAPAQHGRAPKASAAAPAAAVDTGSSRSARSTGMGTAPLDWRCPLEVETGEGASVRVAHPRQLLNQPANLRIILHLVAIMRGQDAAELAEVSARNAARLFDCISHGS